MRVLVHVLVLSLARGGVDARGRTVEVRRSDERAQHSVAEHSMTLWVLTICVRVLWSTLGVHPLHGFIQIFVAW